MKDKIRLCKNDKIVQWTTPPSGYENIVPVSMLYQKDYMLAKLCGHTYFYNSLFVEFEAVLISFSTIKRALDVSGTVHKYLCKNYSKYNEFYGKDFSKF